MMRDLRLTSPYVKGDDIKRLQRALNERLSARGMTTISTDGEYGPESDSTAKQIVWLLGIGSVHLGRSDALRVYHQGLIVDPDKRNADQKGREKVRWKAFQKDYRGIVGVLDWCRDQVGTTESPANSNRGPLVSKWQRDFGMDGQPWCGAFVGYPLRHVSGLPIPNGIVYTPNIIGYGHSRTGGFESVHSWDGRRSGDLILYKWPGISNDFCDHVGILDTDRDHVIEDATFTLEGNTSSGSSGSQNNGGGVYRRDRGPSNVVGVVRPRYR